ncbi:homocysteine S-methyltransferase family protein [uncultured Amphritea sp.]|uniref:homocysteine S-methyltransferase family protein n=1 Tax=Amphritea sp. TaxID=1872502 RepID=UPI0025D9C6A7|nr:homocysteine S-methyltransferase family protein [uncultured Amphritea sp.]
MKKHFPEQSAETLFLTEGGTETEMMYKFGYELPHFAMYPLLNNARATSALREMYQRYLDVAVRHQFTPLIGGLDYRASPDWAALLGYSTEALREMQLRCIDFLREVAAPYTGQLPDIYYAGIAGPKGDAYALNKTISAEEAEDYHSVQMENLKLAGVDLVWAATFNNVPEAIGIARAAASADLPLCLSFTLNSTHNLQSGLSLREAIEEVDFQASDSKPDFYGINCSHPLEFEPALEAGSWFERVRSLRPNAAMMDKISLCRLGHLEDGDPAELGQQLGDLARRYPHIDIWGGCCGTWETHLDQIAANVSSIRRKY